MAAVVLIAATVATVSGSVKKRVHHIRGGGAVPAVARLSEWGKTSEKDKGHAEIVGPMFETFVGEAILLLASGGMAWEMEMTGDPSWQ